MNRIIRLRDGSSLDLLGLGVLVVVVGTIVLGVFLISPTVSMYRNPPEAPTATRDSSAAAKKYTESLAWQRQQVAGRSMFYKPSPPDKVDEPQKVAREYFGPQLQAFVNGTAWFADGQKVSAKEPNGKTVQFVSAKPPWSVRVRWEGGEFDVKLFEKTEFSSLSSASALSSHGSWGSMSGISSRFGAPASERADVPPEARLGPGAVQPGAATLNGGSDAPHLPPPPPSGATPPMPPGGGGGGGGGSPSADPTPASGASPTPAPAPVPTLPGIPLVPQPSTPPEPQREQGPSPEPIRPSHP